MVTAASKASYSTQSLSKSAYADLSNGTALPMPIKARQGSTAKKKYYAKSAFPQAWAMPKATAPDINPDVREDLIYQGRKVVRQMEFQNVYLGSAASWLAMQDKRLGDVTLQYCPGVAMGCDVRYSFVLDATKPWKNGVGAFTSSTNFAPTWM